jgi:hypothetical protein
LYGAVLFFYRNLFDAQFVWKANRQNVSNIKVIQKFGCLRLEELMADLFGSSLGGDVVVPVKLSMQQRCSVMLISIKRLNNRL